jgi:hypothetical protein
VVRIFLREEWIANRKEEGELENLNVGGLVEYWRM